MQPTVKAGQLVYGDVKTVHVLRTKHGALEGEIKTRQGDVDGVLTLGRQLGGEVFDDGTEVEADLEQLESQWALLKESSIAYGEELAVAGGVANDFESEHTSLMKDLVELDVELSHAGEVSDIDLAKVENQETKHKDFHRRFEAMGVRNANVKTTGSRILERCHPKAIRPVRLRLGDLDARWKALRDRSVDRQRLIDDCLILLRGLQTAIDEMTVWLTEAEGTVGGYEVKPVPTDATEIERLIVEIEAFQKRMALYQPKIAALMKYLSSPRRRGSRGRVEAGRSHQVAITALNRRWQALWLRVLERIQSLQGQLEKARLVREGKFPGEFLFLLRLVLGSNCHRF